MKIYLNEDSSLFVSYTYKSMYDNLIENSWNIDTEINCISYNLLTNGQNSPMSGDELFKDVYYYGTQFSNCSATMGALFDDYMRKDEYNKNIYKRQAGLLVTDRKKQNGEDYVKMHFYTTAWHVDDNDYSSTAMMNTYCYVPILSVDGSQWIKVEKHEIDNNVYCAIDIMDMVEEGENKESGDCEYSLFSIHQIIQDDDDGELNEEEKSKFADVTDKIKELKETIAEHLTDGELKELQKYIFLESLKDYNSITQQYRENSKDAINAAQGLMNNIPNSASTHDCRRCCMCHQVTSARFGMSKMVKSTWGAAAKQPTVLEKVEELTKAAFKWFGF